MLPLHIIRNCLGCAHCVWVCFRGQVRGFGRKRPMLSATWLVLAQVLLGWQHM